MLVTGGAGFIGTQLCRKLVSRGAVARVLDLQDPTEPVPGVRYRRADLNAPHELEDALLGVQWVFHLAAVASVERCEREPQLSHRINVEGSLRLLDALQARGGSTRLVFTSSSAIYGMAGNDGRALREDEPAAVPASRYGEQKQRVEQSIHQWCMARQSSAVLLRLFNVFGTEPASSTPSSGVLAVLRECMARNRAFILHGGGEQTRDFLAVDDVVEALVAAAERRELSAGARVINVGSGQGTSIRALANMAMTLCDRSVSLVDGPARVGDVPHSIANIGRAASELQWSPRVPLAEGLRSLFPPR